MLSRIKFEIDQIAEEILDRLPTDVWISDSTTFFDPAIGGGQFVRAVEYRLRSHGHSDENIRKRVFGFEESDPHIRYAVNKHKLVGQYKRKPYNKFLEMDDTMKFDVVIGNPPFNSAKKNRDDIDGNGGTGGNSRLYKHFREKSLDLLKPNGVLAFVSLKNIAKDLMVDGNQIDLINLMTEKDYWNGEKFNTLYFIERNGPKVSDPVWEGGIAAKIFGISEWRYNEFNRTEDRMGTGNITAVINLPKVSNNFVIETALVKTALSSAPRFAFTLLESSKSYTVTDLPFCGSMCGCVTLDSLQEAQALKKFIINNKGLRFFFKVMKLKGYAKDIVRYTKKIDLSQIITGFEYPKEWQLTSEEIDYIENEFI
jgi:hypothetical protein